MAGGRTSRPRIVWRYATGGAELPGQQRALDADMKAASVPGALLYLAPHGALIGTPGSLMWRRLSLKLARRHRGGRPQWRRGW